MLAALDPCVKCQKARMWRARHNGVSACLCALQSSSRLSDPDEC